MSRVKSMICRHIELATRYIRLALDTEMYKHCQKPFYIRRWQIVVDERVVDMWHLNISFFSKIEMHAPGCNQS